MKPNNPFLIAGYYSPEFFCDREQETRAILDALHNGRNVTLIAPRRMGKTGLVRHAFYRLKEEHPDIVTFYLDIYSTQSLGDFVRLFASTVLGQLDSAPQKALSRISQFVRSCRPVFTFDELTGVPIVTIDVAPAEEENTLSIWAHRRNGAMLQSMNSNRLPNIRKKVSRHCCVHISSFCRM